MTNKENAELFRKEWLEGRSVFCIKTSGSTGAPKVIEIRREQMIASAKKTIKALDLQHGMTSLVCLDVNYIAGTMMVVRSMVAGMNMIVVEPKSDPLEDISDLPIDFAALVPYQLDAILGSAHQLRNVKKIILGGAPASPDLLDKIRRIKHTTLYATFGMTETLSHIALQRLNGGDPQDCFHTLDGIDISLDDRGCLVIKADYLDSSVVTNDLVELIDDRSFRWLGRYDNVINSGGVKVIPEKVEQAIGEWLSSNGFDNRFFVTGTPNNQLGTQVVLVVEGWIFKETEDKLLTGLKEVLSKYEVPKKVVYTNAFAHTPTGKINRKVSLENALPSPGGR
jgi:O-succinylbenzoic acid--CoA ligase